MRRSSLAKQSSQEKHAERSGREMAESKDTWSTIEFNQTSSQRSKPEEEMDAVARVNLNALDIQSRKARERRLTQRDRWAFFGLPLPPTAYP